MGQLLAGRAAIDIVLGQINKIRFPKAACRFGARGLRVLSVAKIEDEISDLFGRCAGLGGLASGKPLDGYGFKAILGENQLQCATSGPAFVERMTTARRAHGVYRLYCCILSLQRGSTMISSGRRIRMMLMIAPSPRRETRPQIINLY